MALQLMRQSFRIYLFKKMIHTLSFLYIIVLTIQDLL